MPNFRPVLYVFGLLLAGLGAAMLVPATVDAIVDDVDWHVFVISAVGTSFTGVSLMLAFREASLPQLTLREAFLLTVISWTGIAAFAAIPFLFSNLQINYADSFFEAISGITTTGSTVLTGLDTLPRGLLLWRSLLQWIGGIGIIVTAIALLPLLRVGGMQLFRTESSDRSEKVLPGIQQITTAIFAIYVGLTLFCTLSYWASGMTLFEAINHAMTTLSTGGYSTTDASFGKFASNPLILWVAVVFMTAGGVTFTLYVRVVHGAPGALFRDSQVRWYLSLMLMGVTSIAAWLVWTQNMAPWKALTHAAFNVVSIATTTGYASTDYGLWGSFAVAVIYFLMFMGGCTGSTAGAMKVFRFQVLYAIASQQLMRLLAPHRVIVPRVQDKEITEQVAISVLSFFFFYALSFAVIVLALALFGLDAITALSGAATAIGNVGPGLGGIIGPSGNFSSLPDGAKWILSFGMLLGRLEFVTVFVLLTPSFWRE